VTGQERQRPRIQDITDQAIIDMGRDTFRQEADVLHEVGARLDGDFAKAVRALFAVEGRVLVTGLGKSGIIARKIAATLTSTGTPSHFIHPVEAAHGDLGVVSGADVLIAISRGGNNPEVTNLVIACSRFGTTTVAISCERNSDLAKRADILLHTPIVREACPLGLTPTSSAVAAMAMGDALTTSLIELRGFKADDFARFHPSGALGRSLLMTVGELMHTGDELPLVSHRQTLRQSLPEIVEKRLGGTCVVDDAGLLVGVCVDGDVKRVLLTDENALGLPVVEAMNPQPMTISAKMLAIDALRLMERREGGPVTLLIVVDGDRRPVGLLHIHDVLQAGLL